MYTYKCNYKADEGLRKSFNELTQRTYGFDFEEWYQAGYWGEGYIPYSLIDGEKVVANVSVSIMDFIIEGKEKRYVQIGTVMTDEAYRGQGLSRILMEKVLEEWENQCESIYLFANDRVLDFYPKFGFKSYDEYQYILHKEKIERGEKVRKLQNDYIGDQEILTQLVKGTLPLAKIHTQNNSSLVMFYWMDFMKESIYYIEEYQVAAICEYDEEVLYLQEVFALEEIELKQVINALMKEETKKVVLGFTPRDTEGYEVCLVKEEDTTLFIKEGKENVFRTGKVMFPVLSHA